MDKLTVALGARSYDILIGQGLLDRAAEWLAPLARDQRLIVVSDETVWAAQGDRLRAGLNGIEPVPLLVPPGEGSKSWAELERLLDFMLGIGIERRDHIVAFGSPRRPGRRSPARCPRTPR